MESDYVSAELELTKAKTTLIQLVSITITTAYIAGLVAGIEALIRW